MPAGEAPRAHVPGGSRQIGDAAEEAECEKTREERGAWRRRRETRFIWEKKHPLIPLLPDHVTMETGSLDFSDT